MLQPITCKISENPLQLAKRRILAIEILMPAMVALIFFVRSYRNPGAMIGPAIITLLVLEVILVIETGIVIRKMKGMTLTVSADTIERTGGRFTERIADEDIQGAEIHEKSSGEIASITVKLKNQKMMSLGGFENMESIAQHVENAVPNKSLIRRKKHAIDWDDPWFIVAVAALSLIGIVLIRGLGREVFRVFSVLFFFTYGLFNLLNRPLTRSMGQRFEKFEIIMSAFVVVGAVVLAIGMFW